MNEHQCMIWMVMLAVGGFCTGVCVGTVITLRSDDEEEDEDDE